MKAGVLNKIKEVLSTVIVFCFFTSAMIISMYAFFGGLRMIVNDLIKFLFCK